MTFEFKKTFNTNKMRHYINGENFVIHCQYYLTTMIKIANESKMLDGSKLMINAAKESFYDILSKHFKNEEINTDEDKIKYIEEYFFQIGLGKLKINKLEQTALLENSCIDISWLKKYKLKSSNNINYIASGFLCAVFALLNNKDISYYTAIENELLLKSKIVSNFKIMVNTDEK